MQIAILKNISWAACAVRTITIFQVRPTTWLPGTVCQKDLCALQMSTALQARFKGARKAHETRKTPCETNAQLHWPTSRARKYMYTLGSATGNVSMYLCIYVSILYTLGSATRHGQCIYVAMYLYSILSGIGSGAGNVATPLYGATGTMRWSRGAPKRKTTSN